MKQITEGKMRFRKEAGGLILTEYSGPAEETVLEIPEAVGGIPVCGIAEHAFYANGGALKRIHVPGSVKRIEARAFEFCLELIRLELEEGTEELGEEFVSVSSLEEVNVPASVRLIENPVLLDCRLQISPANRHYCADASGLYERAENGLVLLVAWPVDGCRTFSVRSDVICVAETAFLRCADLQNVRLPAGLCRIEEGALSNVRDAHSRQTGIQEVFIPKENRKIFSENGGIYARTEKDGICLIRYLPMKEDGGFPVENDEMTDAVIRKDTTVIAKEAFTGCSLKRIRIPETVREIHENAFRNCPLEKVILDGHLILFPADNTYQRQKLLLGFGKSGRKYDFTVYDELLKKSSVNAGRILMMAARLCSPLHLAEDTERCFREKIETGLADALLVYADEENLHAVELLSTLGFFTEERIDELIRAASFSENKEIMVWLMNYKREHYGIRKFDFFL